MSNDGNRKSMDDVLASIRRIVKSEKDGGAVDAPDGVEDAVLASPEADAPLALTPDMRTDGSDDFEAQDDPIPAAPQSEAPAEPVDAPVDTAAALGVAAMPDMAGIEDMVRQVVGEEIAKLGFGPDMIRSVLTDELTTGQTGNNISVNVMKLIQAEVSKALGK